MAALRAEFHLVPYAERDEMPTVLRDVAPPGDAALWGGSMEAWMRAMDEWIAKQPDHRALRAILLMVSDVISFIGAVGRGRAVLEFDEVSREWSIT